MASNQNVNKVVYGNTTLIDLTGDDVTAASVLSGKKFHLPSGAAATGTITSQAAQTITPGTSNKTIAAGKYLSGTQTIKGDANLVAGNIKSGVSIFGVSGSYTGKTASDFKPELYNPSNNLLTNPVGAFYLTPGYYSLSNGSFNQSTTNKYLSTQQSSILDIGGQPFYAICGLSEYMWTGWTFRTDDSSSAVRNLTGGKYISCTVPIYVPSSSIDIKFGLTFKRADGNVISDANRHVLNGFKLIRIVSI